MVSLRRIILSFPTTYFWIQGSIVVAFALLPIAYTERLFTGFLLNDIVLLLCISGLCVAHLYSFSKHVISFSDLFFAGILGYMLLQYFTVSMQDGHSLIVMIGWITAWCFLRYLQALEDLSIFSFAIFVMYIIGEGYAFVQCLFNGFNALAVRAWMGNSGYFALHISALLPFFATVCMRKKSINSWAKGLLLGSVLMGILLVLATGSRAAILGCCVSFFFLFRYRLSLLISKTSFIWRLLILFCGAALFFGMVLLKTDSFLGRLTIYKVSFAIWLQHCWLGVGPGRFGVVYNDFQASYFQTLPWGNAILQRGDETYEAFNILLQIITEYGLVGFVLLSGYVIRLCWKYKYASYKPKSVMQEASVAGLISMGISACFANPFHIPFLFFIGIFYTAYLVRQDTWCVTIHVSRYVRTTMLVTIFSAVMLCGMNQLLARSYWRDAFRESVFGSVERSMLLYNKAFTVLHHDGSFLYNYAVALASNGQWERADTLAQMASNYASGIGLYLLRGDIAQKRFRKMEAYQFYQKACYTEPSRLLPQYKLWQWFRMQGDAASELLWRNRILSYPPKVSNDVTDTIIQEVRKVSDQEVLQGKSSIQTCPASLNDALVRR